MSGYVYELRTYRAMPGKLEAMIDRFRSHTVELFDRHGMKSVGYFVQQDRDDTLLYILEHPSREEAEKNWAAFMADPEWKAVKAASETEGKLVASIESCYMNPTDFSGLR